MIVASESEKEWRSFWSVRGEYRSVLSCSELKGKVVRLRSR